MAASRRLFGFSLAVRFAGQITSKAAGFLTGLPSQAFRSRDDGGEISMNETRTKKYKFGKNHTSIIFYCVRNTYYVYRYFIMDMIFNYELKSLGESKAKHMDGNVGWLRVMIIR